MKKTIGTKGNAPLERRGSRFPNFGKFDEKEGRRWTFFPPAVEREGVKNSVYAVDTPIRRGEL